jgi:hypothetical protein
MCMVDKSKKMLSSALKKMHRPGVEPGSTAWKATMLTVTPPTLIYLDFSINLQKSKYMRDWKPGQHKMPSLRLTQKDMRVYLETTWIRPSYFNKMNISQDNMNTWKHTQRDHNMEIITAWMTTLSPLKGRARESGQIESGQEPCVSVAQLVSAFDC